jgi:hypothetical protein
VLKLSLFAAYHLRFSTMNYAHGQAAAPHLIKSMNNANYQYGHPGMYGSSMPFSAPTMMQKGAFVQGIRQRLNIVAILISLFVPWLLFCAMFWTMSFYLHYERYFLCYFIVFLGLCVVAVTGMLALKAIKHKKNANTQNSFLTGGNVTAHEPTWLIVLFASCVLAWIVGVVAGDLNYFNHMEPYYDVQNLREYHDVQPAHTRGAQIMDAGRIFFSRDTKLDLSRSMGFKNLDIYCVAPIVSGTKGLDPMIVSYDFWAVGLNCCSGNHPDFHCGEFNNVKARGGLRLMRDDQRAFYRLAVQQAEAEHTIRADHPLFFEWMQDPDAEVVSYQEEGYKYFLIGIFTYFMLQLFIVVVCCLMFSKMATLT